MDKKKGFFSLFFTNLATVFMPTILAVSFAGSLQGEAAREHVGILRLGNEGLAFDSIAQLFAWSVVLALLITVLTSDIWLKKVLLLWRLVALLVLGVASCVGFAVGFRWFPTDAWAAWVAFIVFFALCFAGGMFGAIVITKLRDKQYNKLLSDYKKREENND